MRVNVDLKGIPGNIEITSNSFTGGVGIILNGEKLPKVGKLTYQVTNSEGELVKLRLKKKWGGIEAPLLFANEREVVYVEPLNGLEKFIAFLPLVFLLFGAVGGFFGALTMILVISNTRAIENKMIAALVNIVIIIVNI